MKWIANRSPVWLLGLGPALIVLGCSAGDASDDSDLRAPSSVSVLGGPVPPPPDPPLPHAASDDDDIPVPPPPDPVRGP